MANGEIIRITKPNYADAPDYCCYYFDLVKETDLIPALTASLDDSIRLFESIAIEKEDYRYQQSKWTVKQVVKHITDCERIYTYRALRFSRLDATELQGFDENSYADADNSNQNSLIQIVQEYTMVRQSTIALFEMLTDAMLDFKGTANGKISTARAWGWMAAGHNIHHCRVLQEKYL